MPENLSSGRAPWQHETSCLPRETKVKQSCHHQNLEPSSDETMFPYMGELKRNQWLNNSFSAQTQVFLSIQNGDKKKHKNVGFSSVHTE